MGSPVYVYIRNIIQRGCPRVEETRHSRSGEVKWVWQFLRITQAKQHGDWATPYLLRNCEHPLHSSRGAVIFFSRFQVLKDFFHEMGVVNGCWPHRSGELATIKQKNAKNVTHLHAWWIRIQGISRRQLDLLGSWIDDWRNQMLRAPSLPPFQVAAHNKTDKMNICNKWRLY